MSCSTLLGVTSVVDNADGFSFSSGQTVNFNSSAAYTLANNLGIATGNIACMKLFLNGSNQSNDGINCQDFTDMSCSGTTCTSSQTKSLSWDAAPDFCATRYFYNPNNNNSTVSKCIINDADGLLPVCTTTGDGFSFNNPRGITISSGYAYISQSGAGDNIIKCTYDGSDGSLSNCAENVGSLSNVEGIATLTNKYLYFANRGAHQVRKCEIDSANGDLLGCAAVGTGFSQPIGISFNNGYIYVANVGGSHIRKCTVSLVDGTLSDCGAVGDGFSIPTAVLLNNGYIYVANYGPDTIRKCTVDAGDGSLTSCSDVETGLSNPTGLVISHGYLYISNSGNSTVRRCEVSSLDGTLSNCISVGSGFSGPQTNFIF
ncbi:MAG: hypothetical protein K0U37_02175 [Gammaproteobacteria bacterium]|nr:hypothetical protein [Gammaproteobacteria bacterium]